MPRRFNAPNTALDRNHPLRDAVWAALRAPWAAPSADYRSWSGCGCHNSEVAPPVFRRIGSYRVSVWAVKHLVSPLDRFVVRISGGQLRPPSGFFVPTLLLTTVGHRSGQERTIPLVFVRDGDCYVVANARPPGERRNPWVANLRAIARGHVRVGRRTVLVDARELADADVDRWWPALVEVWPAFSDHYGATGERSVFVLKPVDRPGGSIGNEDQRP